MMNRVIERATGIEFQAEVIEGGFQVYTMDGEKYKKLKTSTFKKYFKMVATAEETEDEAQEEESTEEEKAEETKAEEPQVHEELSDEKREKMIEKIKKMMALAENNPSEEEALSAALQAHKLMVKYNIHEEDVSLEEVKDEITSIFSEQKHNAHLMAWRKQLGAVVAKAFRCKCYISGQDVVFRGYKDDAQLALEVYLMLYTIGDKLGSKGYAQQMEEEGTGKGAYNSVTLGFLRGVNDAFGEQCTALMVVTPKEVEEEWNDFSKDFKTSKSHIRVSEINGKLYKEGYAEGKAAVKSRGLEEK